MMTAAAQPAHADRIESSVNLYADLIGALRDGRAIPSLPLDQSDPLARIGRELQQLAEVLEHRDRELQQLFDLVEVVERGVMADDVLNRIFDSFADVDSL